ncbi:MAG: acetate--CoA ligase [Deltaproteobacteria bacterium]|nr:acetate--CoA ligase [Deltaproteobacteria bacterium]
MKEIVWRPYGDYLEKSNIGRFMNRHGIKTYKELIHRSTEDIEWFWDAALKDIGVEWFEPYQKILDTSQGFPWARWFVGGKINIVHNCIDRHIREGRGDRVAILWEGDQGDTRQLTYRELEEQVCKIANFMKGLGLKKGDTAGLYMPMIPEVVVAMMACFKIGVVVVPIFSGFGASALAARLADAEAKILFTADGGFRRGKVVPIKEEADKALDQVPSVRYVFVVDHARRWAPMRFGRDLWWEAMMQVSPKKPCKTEELEAEETSLIIYTSGTTGKPKGTVHTHAGALAQMAKEVGYYFDLKPEIDRFFWVSDIGWMMGPWEIIGVQHYGGTYLMYEGVPNYPQPDRLWSILEKHGITILGISPTAIRLLMGTGDEWVKKHDLSRLRILGSTGEPWDPTSYLWFFEKVGGRRCPIINISGGTEVAGCLLAPMPITELKPCSLGGPGLGMDVDVFDEEGKPIREGIGHLVCKKPAPSMTKGFLKDPERYLDTYFSRWPNIWYHGDWAYVDDDGHWFLFGRSDDTIKIAGKRVGPAEIEAALIQHPAVSEAAAIGVPHPIKGEGVVCFVVLKPDVPQDESLREKLKSQVVELLGKTMKPEEIKFVKALPKTRSAKIVRGVIKKKYLGQEIGDIASVENPEALDAITHAF